MDKRTLLKEIEDETRAASLPLKEAAKNLVFGKGSPEAHVMLVGESPGANEDLQGLPFVGAAGKNMDKLLHTVGLSLDDVYIANILKYRPPENRDPNEHEIRTHTPYLVKQIKAIRPKVVCSLGNYATKFFLAGLDPEKMQHQPGITTVHGQPRELAFDGMTITLIPLFHPAAIIYNRKLLPLWEKDMEVVKDTVASAKNV